MPRFFFIAAHPVTDWKPLLGRPKIRSALVRELADETLLVTNSNRVCYWAE